MTNDHKALIARARERVEIYEKHKRYYEHGTRVREASAAADWRALADALERATGCKACRRCGHDEMAHFKQCGPCWHDPHGEKCDCEGFVP